MDRAILFGAGESGRRVYNMLRDRCEILCFVDNDPTKEGTEYCGVSVYHPTRLLELDFTWVYPTMVVGLEDILAQLRKLGIDTAKVNTEYYTLYSKSRENFLKRYAEIAYAQGLGGSVAEAGVYRGDFSRQINQYFPDKRLHLFDTFDGFDKRDVESEKLASASSVQYMRNTTAELVVNKLPNPSMATVHIGYFPETARGIDEEFCFVNLDMDLYQPTLNGLHYFYPRMVRHGVILIHDYFSESYPNVKQAVVDYMTQTGQKLHYLPAGDDYSLAILKVE